MRRALGKMVVGNLLTNAAERYPDALAFYCAGTRRRFTGRSDDRRHCPAVVGRRPART